MSIDECVLNIARYLDKDDTRPRIVNVHNCEDFKKIVRHFDVAGNDFINIAEYAHKDENPSKEWLYNDLSTRTGKCFIIGISGWLRLAGGEEARQVLQYFSHVTLPCHVVVLCLQCDNFLHFDDRARVDSFIYRVAGSDSHWPQLEFVAPELAAGNIDAIGIEQACSLMESMDGGLLIVRTCKRGYDYPSAMVHITEIETAYQALCRIDPTTSSLSSKYGTDGQWEFALRKVSQLKSWDALIETTFGTQTNLSAVVGGWTGWSEDTRWLYFIGLKLYGVSNNNCLRHAIEIADSVTAMIRQIYRGILSMSHSAAEFWQCYEERRSTIECLGENDAETGDYLLVVKQKNADELYYLTDQTKSERERIIELITQYGLGMERTTLLELLSHIYPDLYAYLQPYLFKQEELGEYIQSYKYQKLFNHIDPEFLKQVECQGKNREYLKWTGSRTETVEKLEKSDCKLYFIDALGVEYLGFINEKCKEYKLTPYTLVCHCELPSITSLNKEFLDDFTPEQVCDIKELDDIKHHGKESFDYSKGCVLPIYLARELEIIDDVLRDIKSRLVNEGLSHAYIISDHGASRLAVINRHTNKWTMSESGVHCGRCCLKSEADIKSEYVVDADPFWVLANYDRFKGGRAASVEVHGGATIEEAVIPIIEITLQDRELEVMIPPECLPVKVSFRKKAVLEIFSKTPIFDVEVCVSGHGLNCKKYEAEDIGNGRFRITMPDIRENGNYTLQVFTRGYLVEELPFDVASESVKTTDLGI